MKTRKRWGLSWLAAPDATSCSPATIICTAPFRSSTKPALTYSPAPSQMYGNAPRVGEAAGLLLSNSATRPSKSSITVTKVGFSGHARYSKRPRKPACGYGKRPLMRYPACRFTKGAILKGIVLAGGTGSRLFPLTKITNKHLLPIYDKPMIYYPIQSLVDAGIKDILLVTGGRNSGDFLRLLANGKIRPEASELCLPGGGGRHCRRSGSGRTLCRWRKDLRDIGRQHH